MRPLVALGLVVVGAIALLVREIVRQPDGGPVYRVTALTSLSRAGATPDARVWAVTVEASSPVRTAAVVDADGHRYPAQPTAPDGSDRVVLLFELPAGVIPINLAITDTVLALPGV